MNSKVVAIEAGWGRDKLVDCTADVGCNVLSYLVFHEQSIKNFKFLKRS